MSESRQESRQLPGPQDHYEDLLARLASLETFQRQIRECESAEKAFAIASDHLRRLVPFTHLGFWLVEPEGHEFLLGQSYPENAEATGLLEGIIRDEIAAGTFAWALQQTRPVPVHNVRTGQFLLLNGLATRTRTVGMFVGLLPAGRAREAENARELLSLVFLGLTYTLDNFHLLGELKHYNEHLQDLVQRRTSEITQKNADLRREAADRRRAESALQRSENRYRAVVLALDDGVVILNLAGRVAGCNPSAASILGVSEEELRAMEHFEGRWSWLDQENRPVPASALPFQATLKTGRAFAGEVLGFADGKGEMRWLQVNTQPLREEGESFHNGVIISFVDITEKRQVQKDLLESEERLRNALDAAEDGLWDWDVRTDRYIWNRRYLTMLGYAPDEMEPNAENWRRLIHPDDLPLVLQRRDLHLRGALALYEAEYRMRTKTGGWKWVLDRGRVVSRDEIGKPLRVMGLHQDTTERRLAEEQLRSAKATAESADRAKGEFLAMMSHELRTPMNGIIGFANLLSGTPLTSEQRDYVQLVTLSGQQLLFLLNDLLDFSKIEAGQLVLEKHSFSLRQLLDEVVGFTTAQAREKGLELRLQLQESVPDALLGDPTRLRQILLNLIGNAVKFTEKGKVMLQVREREEEGAPRALWWSVQDSGIGIPEEKQAALFQPFIQADSSTTRRYGGTGLGLAICKRLCDAMGGRIWLESKEGVGSTFHFVTPLEQWTDRVQESLVAQPLPAHLRIMISIAAAPRREKVQERISRTNLVGVAAPAEVANLAALQQKAAFNLLMTDREALPEDWLGSLAHLTAQGERLGVAILFFAEKETVDLARQRIESRFFLPLTDEELENLMEPLSSVADWLPRPSQIEMPLRDERKEPSLTGPSSLRVLFHDRDPMGLKLAQRLVPRLGHRLIAIGEGAALFNELEQGGCDVVMIAFQRGHRSWIKPLRAACERLKRLDRSPLFIAVAEGPRDRRILAPLLPHFQEWIDKPLRLEALSMLLDPLIFR